MKNTTSYRKSAITLAALTLAAVVPSTQAGWDYSHHRDHDSYGRGWQGSSHSGISISFRIGDCFPTVPVGCGNVIVQGHRYGYYRGYYFQPCSRGYVIVNPPVGAVVTRLPYGASYVVVGRNSYYCAGGAYYTRVPMGYAVVNPPVVTTTSTVQVVQSEAATGKNASPAKSSFYQAGHDWAQDLRRDIVTHDQFISYLREKLVKASTEDYSAFRNGFLDTYGVNAEAAFDKAYHSARGA